MRYVADFETTTEKSFEIEGLTRVWCWSIADIDTGLIVERGLDIDSFFRFIYTLESSSIYFHNLKFDGKFITDYMGVKGFYSKTAYNNKKRLPGAQYFSEDKKKTGVHVPMVNSIISNMGEWYMIEFNFNKSGNSLDTNSEKKFTTIKFQDSLKKIPLPVKSIPEAYGLEVCKGEIDMDMYRPVGYNPTDEEWSYVDHDCIIVAQALKYHFDLGLDKLTLAGDALNDFKSRLSKKYGVKLFDYMFPKQNTEIYYQAFKPAYKGGYTWLNYEHEATLIPKVSIYDVNSMYPYIMRTYQLPIGDGVTLAGGPIDENDSKCYIICVKLTGIMLKEGRPAILQAGGIGSEYILEEPTLPKIFYLTHEDWRLVQECYIIEEYHIFFTTYFKETSSEIFAEYIDYWMAIKSNPKTSKGMRQISKLMLNSLYGKFGSNPDKTTKIPVYDEKTGTISYETNKKVDEMTMYTPIAIFITSYARAYLIDSIIANYDRFVYCDTDSLHLIGHEPASGIKVDKFALGAWDLEVLATDAYYIRSKTYTYQDSTKDYRTIKCAGMPDSVKSQVTLDNFKYGLTLPGKLTPKTVRGGCVLVETNYSIN